MEITGRTDEKIYFQNSTKELFINLEVNNDQYGIAATFHKMHNLKLIEKQGTYKMFLIPKLINVKDFDFGWWKDGEVIWTNLIPENRL